jgi:hypothetical protein
MHMLEHEYNTQRPTGKYWATLSFYCTEETKHGLQISTRLPLAGSPSNNNRWRRKTEPEQNASLSNGNLLPCWPECLACKQRPLYHRLNCNRTITWILEGILFICGPRSVICARAYVIGPLAWEFSRGQFIIWPRILMLIRVIGRS